MTVSMEDYQGRSERRSSPTTIELKPGSGRVQAVEITEPGQSVEMPPVRASGVALVRVGDSFVVHNVGTESVTIKDQSGGDIEASVVTLEAQRAAEVFLYENDTTDGSWFATIYESGQSSVTPVTVFGHCFGSGPSATDVWQFQQVVGEWTKEAEPIPEGVNARVGGDDVGGGVKLDGDLHMIFAPAGANRFRRYDSSIDAWTAPLDAPGAARNGSPPFALIYKSSTDEVHHVGIWGSAGGALENERWIYDVGAGTWLQDADLNLDIAGSGWSGKLSTDDKAYTFTRRPAGGEDNQGTLEYDFTNVATEKAICPRPATDRVDGFMIPDEDRFFDLMGAIGFGGGNPSNAVFEFSPFDNEWMPKANVPFTPRTYFYCWGIGGKGYVHGGEDASGDDLYDTYEYDPVADEWTQLENNQTIGAVANDGRGVLAHGLN